MAATIEIVRETGASGSTTETDIQGINTRLDASDSHSTAGTANPIKVPTSGTNYSYWANFKLKVTGGTFTEISNIKWFSDGANGLGTGLTLKASTADGYTQATGSTGTGTELTNANYTGGTLNPATPVDAFTYTSGSPLDVPGTLTSAGDSSNYVVLQLEVADTASAGGSGSETITWQYDET